MRRLRYKRFRRSSLNYRIGGCVSILAFFVLSIAETPIFAQDAARLAAGKWRPKDGTYAGLDANFTMRCGEFGDLIVELAEKSVGGSESSCSVVKLADIAPGTLRLELSCTNSDHPKPRKLSTLLRKIDQKTIVYGENNGRDPGIRYAYCPEETQQLYRDSKARRKAEAEQKAAEERATQKR
jgi:hypothetical protein